MTNAVAKVRVATVWLDGCSGCHMSFLDMDERIVALAGMIDLVYSPLVDTKVFPDSVDVAIVEGAVATNEDLEKAKKIRKHSKFLLALGDCCVTGNVPAMRNPFGVAATMERAFIENADITPQKPTSALPVLLERVRPIHEVVPVDLFVPGCPPPADAIFFVLSELLAGRVPDPSALTRFGK